MTAPPIHRWSILYAPSGLEDAPPGRVGIAADSAAAALEAFAVSFDGWPLAVILDHPAVAPLVEDQLAHDAAGRVGRVITGGPLTGS